jgi:hypothetical protein
VLACTGFTGTVTATLKVAPDGRVTGVTLRPAQTPVDRCLKAALQSTRFGASKLGATFSHAFMFTSCDYDALFSDGVNAYTAGDHRKALDGFERAYACRPGADAALRAFMSACMLRDRFNAARYYQRHRDAIRPALPICVRAGITEADLQPPVGNPMNIAPTRMRDLQIRGDWNIEPDAAIRRAIAATGKDKVVGSFKLCVDATGTPNLLKPLKSTGIPAYDQLIERTVLDWRFKPYLDHNNPIAVCTAVTVIQRSACNANDLTAKGTDEYSRGSYAAALAMFELSLSCKHDPNTVMRAFMAACRAKIVSKAKYFRKLEPAQTARALPVCLSEGISVDDLDAP